MWASIVSPGGSGRRPFRLCFVTSRGELERRAALWTFSAGSGGKRRVGGMPLPAVGAAGASPSRPPPRPAPPRAGRWRDPSPGAEPAVIVARHEIGAVATNPAQTSQSWTFRLSLRYAHET